MTRCLIVLALLVTGCAPATRTQAPPTPAVTPTVPPPISGPQPVQSAAPIALPPPGSAIAPSQATAPSRPATSPSAPTPPKGAAKSNAPAAVPPTPLASAAPAPQRRTGPSLDLKSLEQRLRDTNAIGVLTKLSLKNQVDDLVARFKSYHEGHRPPTLGDLRPAFELLLMKVLSLLQDHDTALANEIDASREAIWAVLTDPRKLAQFT